MPYQKSSRLPFERASKLGHLNVIDSPLVQELCKNFDDPGYLPNVPQADWTDLPKNGDELKIIFSSDGSFQSLENPQPPYKALAFVKTVLFKMDQYAVEKIDKENPHPLAIKDIMSNSALFHCTAFPLRHLQWKQKSIYDGVREIIYSSVKDKGQDNSLDGAMMETLKWIVYEKWNPKPKDLLEEFGCPHCGKNKATLPFDKEVGKCPNCNGEIFITDLFGLHLSMQEDFAPNQIALDYMSVSETLLIFTPVRYFWEKEKKILKNCMLIKDGPLSLRATLAKLSAPIRRFFKYAKEKIGIEVNMLGQEKSGGFYEHLELISERAPNESIFIPNNDYIRQQIQHSNAVGIYGSDTNYGAKVFIKYNDHHKMVLNIPTGERGEFVEEPSVDHLIGVQNIIATLPKILSNKYEGALLPIELANSIASLSTYPSARILELFSESMTSSN